MSATAVLPPNAFIGAAAAPTDADLTLALGPAKPVWDAVIAAVTEECDIDVREWKSYSRKYGWSLRLARRKRTIVWLAPCERQIHVAFILGDRAVAAVRSAKLPARILALLDDAPKYPEGTGVRVFTASLKDVPAIRKLARIKLDH